MNRADASPWIETLAESHDEVLELWIGNEPDLLLQRGLASEAEIRDQCSALLSVVIEALQKSNSFDADDAAWAPVRAHLAEVSTRQARRGFSAMETATFVFSIKAPLIAHARRLVGDMSSLSALIRSLSLLIDSLGLHTVETSGRSRDEIVRRQQLELLELSTPVIQLWPRVLALPLIGTLDSSRAQIAMENLLHKIVATGAVAVVIDITGVPAFDTLVAQHLLKTAAAARLLGAKCVISGMRPYTAQTIVELGINLSQVVTKSTLRDAFVVALNWARRAAMTQ